MKIFVQGIKLRNKHNMKLVHISQGFICTGFKKAAYIKTMKHAHGDLVYELKNIVSSNTFSAQFIL